MTISGNMGPGQFMKFVSLFLSVVFATYNYRSIYPSLYDEYSPELIRSRATEINVQLNKECNLENIKKHTEELEALLSRSRNLCEESGVDSESIFERSMVLYDECERSFVQVESDGLQQLSNAPQSFGERMMGYINSWVAYFQSPEGKEMINQAVEAAKLIMQIINMFLDAMEEAEAERSRQRLGNFHDVNIRIETIPCNVPHSRTRTATTTTVVIQNNISI